MSCWAILVTLPLDKPSRGSCSYLVHISFTTNCLMLFLNQQQRNNGCKKYFYDQSSRKKCCGHVDQLWVCYISNKTDYRKNYRPGAIFIDKLLKYAHNIQKILSIFIQKISILKGSQCGIVKPLQPMETVY